MTNEVQLIKLEIGRRIELLEPLECEYNKGSIDAYKGILRFINSLPEESGCEKKDYRERYEKLTQSDTFKSSYCDKSLGKEESTDEANCTTKNQDLDEELRKILNKHYYFPDGDDELRSTPELAKYIAYHFAEWQRHKDQQTIELAEDEEFYNDLPCVVYNEDEEYPCYEIIDKNNYGDWTHHLSKQQYKWYLPFPEKGGEE